MTTRHPDAECANRLRRDFLKLGAGLLVAGAFPTLAGCKAATPLTIATSNWPGYAFLSVAMENGTFSPEVVRLVKTSSIAASIKLLSEGRVDGAAITLDEALRLKQQGIELSVVLLFDVSVGGDALLAKPEVKTLADLKGKRLGLENSTLAELMLDKALEAARLTRQDLVVVPMEDHEKAWNTLGLDAIITYEPNASKFESNGALRLFDSHEVPDTILDVLAVRSELVDHYQHQLRALIKANLIEANNWKHNPVDTSFHLSKVMDVPAEKVAEQFRGLQIPDLEYNRHMLSPPAAELGKAVVDIQRILFRPLGNPSALPTILFQADFLPEKIG
jgi:NitT/TauT family transport system substrate-binding protein